LTARPGLDQSDTPVAGLINSLALHPGQRNIRRMSDPFSTVSSPTRLSLRLVFGDAAMFGPGKADLLEHIRESGSISAAGRQMRMSYKRAWMLVEEMNAAFRDPLVDSTRGGPNGGGARLTAAGQTVLAQYRSLEATVVEAGAAQIATLHGMLRDISGQK
jgi:molybdate transport system regulatory protein